MSSRACARPSRSIWMGFVKKDSLRLNLLRIRLTLNSLPDNNMSGDPNVTFLYRPVGPGELELIARSGYREFPPRLPSQPIFYPVLNQEYAAQIAREWNAKDPKIGAGFVTRFRVRSAYLSKFEVQTVGGAIHQEYWIPAQQLADFNANIVGPIEVVGEFRSEKENASDLV